MCRIFCLIAIISVLLCFPDNLRQFEFPVFRVVIDPGHGGISDINKIRFGDRYDPISGTYLQVFRDGAVRGKLEEHKIVYEIAIKVYDILGDCSPDGNYANFYKILERFCDNPPEKIFLRCMMSRGDSRNESEIAGREDPNAEFRLFDYPDKNGNILPGRISRINAFKPHLVVSLHINGSGTLFYNGMNPVILPPYKIMRNGLLYLQGKETGKNFFRNSLYNDWLDESNERKGFDWFLNDSALYFTGYPLNKDRSINTNDFKGYRYNMTSWSYRDEDGWAVRANQHPDNSSYSASLKTFAARGKFFEREQSQFESFKRDAGEEGFGGDNYYASAEIIRYILLSLHLNNISHPDQKLGKSYISVWHMPMLVNAVNSFVELGYLGRPRFRYLLTTHQDEIARGIAVGIYSLFAGIKQGKSGYKYLPRGKKIDLKKYNITTESSYFDLSYPE
jgi:hypothetical protein